MRLCNVMQCYANCYAKSGFAPEVSIGIAAAYTAAAAVADSVQDTILH